MNRTFFILANAFAILICTSTSTSQETKLNLPSLYEKVVARSEALKRDEASIDIAQAKYKQAISALYPILEMSASEEFRNANSFQNERNSQSSRQDQFQTGFRVTQPIFRGFSDIFLAEAAEKSIEAERHARLRNAQLLYERTAELFYQVLLYESDLDAFSDTEKTLNSRIKELTEWLSLGKSKESEKLVAESDIASVKALSAQSRKLISATKEALAFLTGLPSTDITLDSKLSTPILEPIENYITHEAIRPDIEAAKARVNAQRLVTKATERERWPEVNLEGNSYTLQSPDARRDWDVTLRLSLPIFEGGLNDARVAEQNARLRSEELSLQEIMRKQEEEIRTSYVTVQGAIAERKALEELLSSTTKNLAAQREDYKLGIVTNLDVLAAIRQLQDAKRRVNENRINSLLAFEKLLVAAGRRG